MKKYLFMLWEIDLTELVKNYFMVKGIGQS